MPARRWFLLIGRGLAVAVFLASGGCESAGADSGVRLKGRRTWRPAEIATARLAQDSGERRSSADVVPAQPVGPNNLQPVVTAEQFRRHLADPSRVLEVIDANTRRALEEVDARRLSPEAKAEERASIEALSQQIRKGVLERVEKISRPDKVKLTLTDAIRRAVEHNYGIQAQSYSPAIEAARVVEAEAQFDATYYANFTSDKRDSPTATELVGTQTNTRIFETGIRKLLSTGMQVRTSYNVERHYSNVVFTTINPSYNNSFAIEFNQPLLRGFGLDYNRSQIELKKLDREISIERLRGDVQELLFNVEQSYWQLMQARATVTILAQLLAQLETIYDSLEQRFEAGYDAYAVQLNQIKSRIERREADFVRAAYTVKNAEDGLKRLMNDPDLNLSEDVEIIPWDLPNFYPIVLDQLGEATAALAHRPELHEAKLTIEQAEIGIGAAKNQALPRLDVIFRYAVNGLGPNWDRAFDQLTAHNFQDYLVKVEFEWDIGARAGEAALRAARFQQAQAIAGHRDAIEQVLLEVNQGIREIYTNYDQLGPSFRQAEASYDWMIAIRKRQERRDPPSLQVEIDSHESLAGARDGLLQALINYNIALTNLERRKGTLMEFNNIVLSGADDEHYQRPYRPVAPSP